MTDSSATMEDESELVGRAAAGSSSAFNELFNRYYPMIHAFAFRLALCPAEAADIAQDTFIQAARALPGFRREASFKNWLYTIATNKSRDRRRQHGRRARLSEDWKTLHNSDDPAPAESAGHAAVRHALIGLAPEQREAVALVFYEGMKHADAARVLGCAEATISWRIFRAKQKLKQALGSRAASANSHE